MRPNSLSLLTAALTLLLAAASARALIVGGGTEPAQDHNWPLGAVELANLPSRVGWCQGDYGPCTFLYRGDAEAFNTALEALAKIEAPAVKLVVDDGPEEDFWLQHHGFTDDAADIDAKSANVDWRLEAWDPTSWHHLFNNPQSFFDADHPNFRQPLPPPTITVYIGGGGVDWKDVKVPKNVTVVDRRAQAARVKLEGGALVRGHVYDMNTSKPIVDASVGWELAGQENREADLAAASDEHGRFEIPKIPAGTYRLVVGAQGYASKVVTREQFKPTTFRQFDVLLARAATVSGRVVDEAGKPIAGASVRAQAVMGVDCLGYKLPTPIQTTTDKDGGYELAGLPAGYTVLMCFTPHYSYSKGNTLTQTPAKDVTLPMTRTGAVRVKLLDSKGLAMGGGVHIRPVAAERVGSWFGDDEIAGADGTYLFESVPPGHYIVSGQAILPPGLKPDPTAETITVTGGQTTEVTIGGDKTKRPL